MCLTINNIKLVRYGRNIVGFKTFGVSYKRGLIPSVYVENDYYVSIDKDSGDYVITSNRHLQQVELDTEIIDLQSGHDGLWMIYSYLPGLGIHSYTNTKKNLVYEYSDEKGLQFITLIVLIEPGDVQIISNGEIVSWSVIIPRREKFKQIVQSIIDYDFKNKYKL